MQALIDFAKRYGLAAGRFLITFIFLRSALGKITGFTAVSGIMAKKGVPCAEVFLAAAIALEIAGGLMVLLGWHARLGALLLAVFLIPATLIFHNFWAVDPAQLREAVNQTNHFYKNVSILGALVFLIGMGPGAQSLRPEPGDTAPGRREGVEPAT
jgi:putative oxidoreductase